MIRNMLLDLTPKSQMPRYQCKGLTQGVFAKEYQKLLSRKMCSKYFYHALA